MDDVCLRNTWFANSFTFGEQISTTPRRSQEDVEDGRSASELFGPPAVFNWSDSHIEILGHARQLIEGATRGPNRKRLQPSNARLECPWLPMTEGSEEFGAYYKTNSASMLDPRLPEDVSTLEACMVNLPGRACNKLTIRVDGYEYMYADSWRTSGTTPLPDACVSHSRIR